MRYVTLNVTHKRKEASELVRQHCKWGAGVGAGVEEVAKRIKRIMD